RTPESEVRGRILTASQMPLDTEPEQVARRLGCGELVTAPDTVPFCLWVAAHHLGNYPQALATAISAGGDCDTNAAIVGGIVASGVAREGIPAGWLTAKERFNL